MKKETTATEHCTFCDRAISAADLAKAIVRNNEVICPGCAPGALRENIAQARKIKARTMTAIIIAVALMAAGLFSAYTGAGRFAGASTESALLTIMFFFGAAVMPTIWYAAMERNIGRPLLLPGAPGMALRLAARMSLAFVMGVALAPLSVLQNMKSLKNLDAQIAGCESLLQNYT